MRLLHSEVEIDAPPSTVWRILTDFDSFPQWNPFIARAEGRLAPGERLTIELRLFGPRPVRFRPTVLSVVPGTELRWQAVTGRRGVLDTERIFVLEPLEGGRTRFHQSEVNTGMLTPAMKRTHLDRRILRGYEQLNEAIKARAEAAAAAPTR